MKELSEMHPIKRLRHLMTEAGRNPRGRFSKALKGRNARSTISQAKLAEMLGLERDMIAKIEKGERKLSKESAERLAEETGAVVFPLVFVGVHKKGEDFEERLEVRPSKTELLTLDGREYSQDVYEDILGQKLEESCLDSGGSNNIDKEAVKLAQRRNLAKVAERRSRDASLLLLRMKALLDAAERCGKWEEVHRGLLLRMCELRENHVDDDSLEKSLEAVEKAESRTFSTEGVLRALGIDERELQSDLKFYRNLLEDSAKSEAEKRIAESRVTEIENKLESLAELQREISSNDRVKLRMVLPLTWPHLFVPQQNDVQETGKKPKTEVLFPIDAKSKIDGSQDSELGRNRAQQVSINLPRPNKKS